MGPVVYDLTEVFYASRGKLKFYGIARVVIDIARELRKLDPSVRFALYSPGHDDFFEVFPELDDEREAGVELNVPLAASPLRVREVYHRNRRVIAPLLAVTKPVIRAANRRRWRLAGANLPRINLDGCKFIMTGRPKLMLSPIESIKRKKWKVEIHALLHDMIPLHNFSGHASHSFPRNFMMDNRYVIEQAHQIIANSEFTKRDIEDFSAKGIMPPLRRIVAVPLVHECRAGDEPAQKQIPNEPYLLAVGALVGRKNIEIAFNAMLDLAARGRPVPRLVLAGAVRDHIKAYLAQERYAPIRDLVEQSANPNQTDLVRYYEQAVALVIASRMEGWGLPAGEALWLGTPVLCSTAPVFQEVCGDLGLYFDPDDPRALADHIDRLMNEDGFRDGLVARIRAARPQLRKWEDVGRDILAVV